MKKRIIVVDDEPRISNSLEMILSEKGYDVTKASSGKEAIDLINREDYDLLIADLILPGMTGLELLKSVKKSHPMLPVFIVTTFATINAAVLAMKEGAEDFVTKPILESEIKLKIDRTIERYQVLQENIRLREEVRAKYSSEEHGFTSGVMHDIYRKIEEYSKNERPVFVIGENGTGKETIAKSIHFNSARSRKPFIKVDVSIIPKNIQVKKIFGGLAGGRGIREVVVPGEVDLANEGSIYFEHIEQLQPESQKRLLRLMLEGKIDRAGDGSIIDTLDVRVICSSSVDLTRRMEEGKFKTDLWQHLMQAPIMVPPLRDRKEDILSLVTTFINKWSENHHKPVKQISQEALELLYAYHWPGNIRELENVVERAVLLAKGEEIEPDNLLINIVRLREQDAGLRLLSLEAMEKQHIARVLEYTNWNKTRASQILGINRKTLLEKRKKFNLK
ncbi:MAG: sigma-54-dependent transcriptional regulator [Candidatus Glassbacteria bacterium]